MATLRMVNGVLCIIDENGEPLMKLIPDTQVDISMLIQLCRLDAALTNAERLAA